jgi:hypothetical protein
LQIDMHIFTGVAKTPAASPPAAVCAAEKDDEHDRVDPPSESSKPADGKEKDDEEDGDDASKKHKDCCLHAENILVTLDMESSTMSGQVDGSTCQEVDGMIISKAGITTINV